MNNTSILSLPFQVVSLQKQVAKESTYIQDDWYVRCSHCHALIGGASSNTSAHLSTCPMVVAQNILAQLPENR